VLGPLTIERGYYHCPHCHHGHCPGDAAFGLEHSDLTSGAAELATLAGTLDNFARAAAVLGVDRRGVARRGGHQRIADDGDVAGGVHREPGREWGDDGEECLLLEDVSRQETGVSGIRVENGMASPAPVGSRMVSAPRRQTRPHRARALPVATIVLNRA
jgi:hypothetical protein